jgi:hypothetical protein
MAASSSANSPAAIPCAAGPITSAGRIVPLIVAGCAGQSCVPAGPFPRFVHRKTEMPPLIALAPKWMWAWVTADPSER